MPIILKYILSFFVFIAFCKINAQQNDDFKQVSDYFTYHKKAIADEFKTQIKNEKNLTSQFMLKSTMEDFAKRLDSTENVSFTYALIATKNKETLKPKEAKIKKIDKKLEDSSVSYPGGLNALREEIHTTFYYDAKHNTPINFVAKVKFLVDVDGYVKNVVAEGENSVFNKQAEIAVYRLRHPFTPKYKDGYPVKSWFTLPIKMSF